MSQRWIVPVMGLMALWTASAAPARASVLLATYDFWTNGGGAPESDPRVEVILQLPTDFPPTSFFGLGQGLGLFWESGAQGTFDFTPENDPGFDEFATFATDGAVDYSMLWTLFPSGGGKGNLDTESNIFGTASDLAGATLDTVRLVVDEVSITPYTPDPVHFPNVTGFKFDVKGAYEFYGTPVPEPGTLTICALGVLVIFKRLRPT